MTKPYRIVIQKNGEVSEYYLSPLIPYYIVALLVKEMSSYNNLNEAEEHFKVFKEQSHIL
ncbi:hypothetical protein D3C87_130400 [compost metagenome]